ncbi:MAG: hypothetical protein ACP5HK_04230 [Acidilobus sp.]
MVNDLMSTPVNRLTELLKGMSRRGGETAQASASISQVLELKEAIDELLRLAECLSTNKGECTKLDSTSLCDSKCGSLYLMREGEVARVWRVGSKAFSAIVGPSLFSVSTKDYGIDVTGEGYRARLLEGSFAGGLSAEDLTRDSQMIVGAAGRLLVAVKAAIDSLVGCAREQGVRCS